MILSSREQRIVVGDSDRAVLELLQIRLDVAGHRAFVARTGPAVLELVRTARPALLILDLNIAELDGYSVLELLNKQREISYPVLVTSKKLSVDNIERAISLGARDVIAKPFSGTDVVERVGRLLRGTMPVREPVFI